MDSSAAGASPPPVTDRWPLWTLGLALLASGAAGLTYQVLWLRLLSTAFGVTAYAASTVLAAFMAGLALGSVIAGRLASRSRCPLRLFAVAELGIAATALLSPLVLAQLPSLARAVHDLAGDHRGALTAARFVAVSAILLLPTTFMGATLPLVTASRVMRTGAIASRIGAAYAVNTTGAIAGALLTGFVFVGSLGIRASFGLAAGCNILAAALGLLLSLRLESARSISGAPLDTRARPTPARPSDRHGEPAPGEPPHGVTVPAVPARVELTQPDGHRRLVVAALGISGLASLALEVIWFRVLVLFIPATTYAFTTMLATVLGGIAIGGFVAARLLQRERDWTRTLAGIQAATAVAIVASFSALCWTYAAGWRTSGQIQASVVAILPATLLMGLAFPIGVRLWTAIGRAVHAPQAVARQVGTLYAVNVCGAIAGAVLGGFLLLPALGSRSSLVACAGLYLCCGGALAWTAPHRRRALAAVSAWAALFVILVAALPSPLEASLARRHGRQDRVLWHEEGVQTTVSVHLQAPRRHVLYLDGLHQSDDSPEMLRTHREIGHLPMILHRAPRRALVVGLGGGATAGAVSQHAAQVQVVELSDSVRKGAAFFAHANYDVLRRANVRLRVDDGRNYLQSTTARYDVITADIIQPGHAGAGLVYSVEYYRLARRALARDGLMLQWVGHRTETEYRLLVRTFLEVFPHATLWMDGTLLVGGAGPLALSRSAFEAQRAHPETRQALDAIGLDSFEALLARFRAGAPSLARFIGRGEILSDDRPRLEYNRSIPRGERAVDFASLPRNLAELRIED